MTRPIVCMSWRRLTFWHRKRYQFSMKWRLSVRPYAERAPREGWHPHARNAFPKGAHTLRLFRDIFMGCLPSTLFNIFHWAKPRGLRLEYKNITRGNDVLPRGEDDRKWELDGAAKIYSSKDYKSSWPPTHFLVSQRLKHINSGCLLI